MPARMLLVLVLTASEKCFPTTCEWASGAQAVVGRHMSLSATTPPNPTHYHYCSFHLLQWLKHKAKVLLRVYIYIVKVKLQDSRCVEIQFKTHILTQHRIIMKTSTVAGAPSDAAEYFSSKPKSETRGLRSMNASNVPLEKVWQAYIHRSPRFIEKTLNAGIWDNLWNACKVHPTMKMWRFLPCLYL